MSLHHLFPTTVGIYQASADQIKSFNSQIDKNIDDIKKECIPAFGDNVSSSIRSHRHLLENYKLNLFNKWIEERVFEFYKSSFPHKLVEQNLSFRTGLTESWANVTYKHGFQDKHNHLSLYTGGHQISGAYFYKTNGNDGNLVITTPSLYRELGYEGMRIAPVEGQLVLFRSNVEHRVTYNQTESERITFSFNYYLY